MAHFTKIFGLAAVLAAVAACSGTSVGTGTGEDNVTSGALAFHAEASPLKDFAYDTGLVPAGSPAQVQLKLSAGGGIKVDAAADKSKDGLVGKPGAGKLALDLHVKMDGRLKVESTFKSYDGDLPGLKDIDIPIKGEVPFDGLLLGAADSAEVKAELPETTLPEIPLGSIPGSLVITVAQGSVLTTKFHGSCLSVAGGQATYNGESKTSGSLILKGKIVLKLPAPLNKSVDLPEITVAIPEVTTAADSAAVAVPGVADAQNGACGAAPASDAPKPTTGTDPTSDAGAGGTDGGTDAGYNGEALTCGGVSGGTAKCDTCLSNKCCTVSDACVNDVDCAALLDCIGLCADKDCATQCKTQHPAGKPKFDALATCITVTCDAECK